ncbi:hypothetical protein J5N97_012159 [Dioscorea zingiberensis]|uniref:Uncharacterized protein n=1 Tax=Dioscorea zingiberensis TaxID=325984 RepID=A0A9D5CNM8_9LILI|nr:hypothetical protein J5N97_012159 [Dioscorea zingiberensis]
MADPNPPRSHSSPPNDSSKTRRSLPSRLPSFQRRLPGAPPSLDIPSARGYVSFRDLIIPPPSSPAPTIQSPTADQIEISNPLVKHAAYAYLQPTPSQSHSDRRRHSLCSCFDFIYLLFRRSPDH